MEERGIISSLLIMNFIGCIGFKLRFSNVICYFFICLNLFIGFFFFFRILLGVKEDFFTISFNLESLSIACYNGGLVITGFFFI